MGIETSIHNLPSVCEYELVIDQQVLGSQFRLSYSLTSRVGAQGHRTFSDVALAENPLVHFRTLFSQIELLKKGDAAIAQERLSGIGITLGQQLLPPDLRAYLWEVQNLHANSATLPTLHLISNETSIPWELLKVGPPGRRSKDGPFLVEAFALTRWLSNFPDCLSLPLRKIASVVPRDSGLASVQTELEFLRSLAGGDRQVVDVPARTMPLVDALESGLQDGWHYAGHGLVPGTIPGLWTLRLEGQESLQVTDLAGRASGLGAPKPLVFLNTCRSGLGAFSLTGVGGWANGFIEAGAGAFIGSHWAISDAPAAEFAKVFYTQFLSGKKISEAVRIARHHIKKEFPGNPTWLAYTVFAHPFASCTSVSTLSVRDEKLELPAPCEEPSSEPDGKADPQLAAPASEKTASPTANFDVFLSYNRADRELVHDIAKKLELRGLRVWIDIRDLTPGRSWHQELEAIIGQIKAAVIFISPAGFGRWHRMEMESFVSQAVERGIPVIPILLPGVPDSNVPLFLRQFAWLEYRYGESEKPVLDRLVSSIKITPPQEGQRDPLPQRRPWWRRSRLWWLLVLAAVLTAIALWFLPAPRTSAAVLTFVNDSGDPRFDWLSEALPEALSRKLGIGDDVRVVSREHVVLSEINLGFDRRPRSKFSREELRRLRGLLSADFAVVGVIHSIGYPTVELQLKMLDLRDGREVLATRETREESSWVELADRASGSLPDSQPNLRDFLKAQPLSAAEAAGLKASFPKSLDAARLYSEGIARSYRFDRPAAAASLEKATASEPHPRILAALAEQQYFLGQHDLAKATLVQAHQGYFPFEPAETQEMAFLTARLERNLEAVLVSSEKLFLELFPDDLNRGIDYAGIVADLGGFEQVLLIVDDLAKLPGAGAHPQIPLLRARARDASGNYQLAEAEAGQALERALKLEAMHEAALARMELGSLATEAFEPAKALEHFAEARQLFRKLSNKTNEGRCLELAARVARKDNLPLAADQILQAIEIYEKGQFRRDLARAYHILEGILRSQGRISEALSAAEKSRLAAENLWYSDADGDELQANGYYLHLDGKLAEARHEYLAAAAIYSRAGEDDYYGILLTNLGELELVQGRFAEADAYFQEALSQHFAGLNPISVGYDLLQAGRLFAATGDYVLAENRYQDGLARLEVYGEDLVISEIEIAWAELDIGLGNFGSCLDRASRAAQRLRGGRERDLRAGAEALRLRCLVGLGRLEEAAEVATGLRGLELHDFRSSYLKTIALAIFGAARGESNAALIELATLAKEANGAHHLLFELEILLATGEIALKRGDSAAGRELLEQLAARAKGLGAIQVERRAEALLQSAGKTTSSVAAPSQSRQRPRSPLAGAAARQSSSMVSGASSTSRTLAA